MLSAAADAVATLADASSLGAPLLPGMDELREVSASVAIAVAKAAEHEGVARVPLGEHLKRVHRAMWRPDYPATVTLAAEHTETL